MSNMADIFVGNMHIFPFLSTWYHPRLFDGFVLLIFLVLCVVCFVSLVFVLCLFSNVSRVSGHVLSFMIITPLVFTLLHLFTFVLSN